MTMMEGLPNDAKLSHPWAGTGDSADACDSKMQWRRFHEKDLFFFSLSFGPFFVFGKGVEGAGRAPSARMEGCVVQNNWRRK